MRKPGNLGRFGRQTENVYKLLKAFAWRSGGLLALFKSLSLGALSHFPFFARAFRICHYVLIRLKHCCPACSRGCWTWRSHELRHSREDLPWVSALMSLYSF